MLLVRWASALFTQQVQLGRRPSCHRRECPALLNNRFEACEFDDRLFRVRRRRYESIGFTEPIAALALLALPLLVSEQLDC